MSADISRQFGAWSDAMPVRILLALGLFIALALGVLLAYRYSSVAPNPTNTSSPINQVSQGTSGDLMFPLARDCAMELISKSEGGEDAGAAISTKLEEVSEVEWRGESTSNEKKIVSTIRRYMNADQIPEWARDYAAVFDSKSGQSISDKDNFQIETNFWMVGADKAQCATHDDAGGFWTVECRWAE